MKTCPFCGAPCYEESDGRWYCQNCGTEIDCEDTDIDFVRNVTSSDLKGYQHPLDNLSTYFEILVREGLSTEEIAIIINEIEKK